MASPFTMPYLGVVRDLDHTNSMMGRPNNHLVITTNSQTTTSHPANIEPVASLPPGEAVACGGAGSVAGLALAAVLVAGELAPQGGPGRPALLAVRAERGAAAEPLAARHHAAAHHRQGHLANPEPTQLAKQTLFLQSLCEEQGSMLQSPSLVHTSPPPHW